jgi:hypothetical protein
MHRKTTNVDEKRLMDKIFIFPLALTLAMLAHPLAQAQVFLCVSPTGGKELTDTYKPGCKALDVPGNISAPSPRAKAPRSSAPVSTPGDFPRVDNAQQRARDSDRRDILNEELRSQEAKLAEMRTEFKGGEPDRLGNERNYAKYQERVAQLRDGISRAEKDIEALRRELQNIK